MVATAELHGDVIIGQRSMVSGLLVAFDPTTTMQTISYSLHLSQQGLTNSLVQHIIQHQTVVYVLATYLPLTGTLTIAVLATFVLTLILYTTVLLTNGVHCCSSLLQSTRTSEWYGCSKGMILACTANWCPDHHYACECMCMLHVGVATTERQWTHHT